MYTAHLFITTYVDILLGGSWFDVFYTAAVPGTQHFLKSLFVMESGILEIIDVVLQDPALWL